VAVRWQRFTDVTIHDSTIHGAARHKSTGGSRHESALMKTDGVPPDVPLASLNPEKDPDEWVTKDEPMTGPQRSYLQTLCREAGEKFNENWTKAEASKKIDELQQTTGRGKTGTTKS
jgi:hypothetical protein